MNKKLIIIIVVLSLLSTNLIFAEGWTKKAGKSFLAIDYRFSVGSKYHDNNGDNVEIEELKDLAFNLFSEYGITDDFTLRLNIPFYKVLDYNLPKCEDCSPSDINNDGIGDLDIGFRYKIKTFGQTVLATSLTFGIPLSEENLYGNLGKLALGDGEFNQILGLEVGHSLYPFPGYLSGGVKFNNRNEGYSDQFRLGVEGGYKFNKSLLFNLRLSLLKSLNNGNKTVYNNIIPIHANNQEYLAVRIGGFYNFYKNLGFAATANFGLYAINVLSAPVYSIGIYIK